ncbi:MAG TPA: hypothetical protein VIR04_04535 [Paralcaligenes sp.]
MVVFTILTDIIAAVGMARFAVLRQINIMPVKTAAFRSKAQQFYRPSPEAPPCAVCRRKVQLAFLTVVG